MFYYDIASLINEVLLKKSFLGAQFKGRTKVSKTFSVGSIPTARVKDMANVVKWLTHQIVALARVGSIPIIRLSIIGVQPSGKARDFDSLMRWFESSYPSYCRRGGIGRRAGLKIQCPRGRAGSTPAAGIVAVSI